MDKQDLQQLLLVDNDKGEKKRFELDIEGKIAFVDYMISKQQIIYLTHTEVPVGLEGKGVGSVLVKKVLEHVAASNLKMAPLCPFVAAYLKRHPEMAKGLLAPGFSVG